MGGIIIDIRTALRFKGSVLEIEKVMMKLKGLQKAVGSNSIMIETVPFPETTIPIPDNPAIILGLRYEGSLSGLQKFFDGMTDIMNTVKLDTVPLPERLMIGTWPTPDNPALRGIINVRL